MTQNGNDNENRVIDRLKANLITFSIGLLALGYGLKGIVTQRLSGSDFYLAGAQWQMQGLPAVLFGAAVLALGMYLLWLSFTLNE